jgi:hypothetical protein
LAAAAGLAVNPAAEVADKLASFFSFLARFSAAVLRSGFFSAPGKTGSSAAVLDLKYFKYCLYRLIYLYSFIDFYGENRLRLPFESLDGNLQAPSFSVCTSMKVS